MARRSAPAAGAEPTGSMSSTSAAGTTEVAVIGASAASSSPNRIRVGGDELDEAIVVPLQKQIQTRDRPQTAEEVKLEAGSAAPLRPRPGPRSAVAIWSADCRRRRA